jgi:acyl-CoA thioester hydrolase
MRPHIYKTRVRYAEVDQMGVVYYANYLAYLESGRTELMRMGGFPYSKIEEKGLLLPVTECKINYKSAARYDEEISIETTVGFIKNASVKFDYVVRNQAGKVIVLAHTIHPFVSADWKIVEIPPEIKAVLQQYTDG